jgi:hypothetical protein
MRRDGAALPSGAMLTHFTRASRQGGALDNLIAILREGVVRGSSRMVRNKSSVVCLFDASLSDLARALAPRNRRRYQPFGIALDKRYASRMGARPVIYMPWDEARRIIPEHELWRVVHLDIERVPAIDWSFEREWRIAGDLRLAARHAVALVESWRDADAIFEHFDGHPPCAGVLPLQDVFGARDVSGARNIAGS